MSGQAAENEGERKGDFLGGKYLLEDCLGIGGMGEVYRATNVSLGRKVAIKLLNKEHTSNEDDVMRFLREARAAAAVRHPNVVDVFDVARDDDGTPFIVQELLSGQDLEQYLGASGGRLAAEEALEIILPVADAVAAAHARDVVHRDLKPANIFLAKEGNKIIPKVLDFGACLYQTVGALSAKERRMLIGTPHYMAPEQITTAMDVDARADIWAMGVILYELLVGETPFEAEDANAVLKLVRTRSVPRLRKVVPTVPDSLDELVMRCLDRDRRKRFADAAAMRVELAKIRKELRGGRKKRVDTDPDMNDVVIDLPPRSNASRATEASPETLEREERDKEPPSRRVPSLVLKGTKTVTKRRGSSLLSLSPPEEKVSWDTDPPKSASRPIEAAKPIHSDMPLARLSLPADEGPKPARTAADVIREAEAASGGPSSARPVGATSSPPSMPSLTTPASLRFASPPPAPPPSRPREQGAPRDLDLDDADEPALDLDLSPVSARRGLAAGNSSIPPVLDPRAAAGLAQRSDRPPVSVRPSTSEKPGRTTFSGAQDTSLTPPLPLSARSPRPSAASFNIEPALPWTPRANATFGAAIVVPAVAAFVALHMAPFVTAPLGHAMRGDSPLAAGVLAVLTLVGAAALATRALGSSRSPGMLVATIGAVLLGIVMIIVTFSSSETAELGIPPAAGGVVPFIAPIIPLGLGLVTLARARKSWLSRYDRSAAMRSVVITSLMLLAMLEVGPFGAVRAATVRASAPSTVATPARPAP